MIQSCSPVNCETCVYRYPCVQVYGVTVPYRQVSVTLDPADWAVFAAWCARQGKTRTAVLRSVVHRAAEQERALVAGQGARGQASGQG